MTKEDEIEEQTTILEKAEEEKEGRRLNRTQMSELIDQHPNTLVEWEKKYNLIIPVRPGDKRNIKMYTEREIKIMKFISECHQQKFSEDMTFKFLLDRGYITAQEEGLIKKEPYQSLPAEKFMDLMMERMMKEQKELINYSIAKQEESTSKRLEIFKQQLKEELREEIRRELIEENKRQQDQRTAENQKLLDHIQEARKKEKSKEEPKEEKKSLWSFLKRNR